MSPTKSRKRLEYFLSILFRFCVHCSTTQSPLRSSPSILLVRGDVDAALSNTRKLKNLSWIYPFLIFFGFFVVVFFFFFNIYILIFNFFNYCRHLSFYYWC
jgi:hypothetical protein